MTSNMLAFKYKKTKTWNKQTQELDVKSVCFPDLGGLADSEPQGGMGGTAKYIKSFPSSTALLSLSRLQLFQGKSQSSLFSETPYTILIISTLQNPETCEILQGRLTGGGRLQETGQAEAWSHEDLQGRHIRQTRKSKFRSQARHLCKGGANIKTPLP